MSFVAVAVAASAAAGAIGAAISSSASKSAAKTQAESASEATRQQREMYEEGRADLSPWRTSGGESLNRLNYLLGLPGGTAGPSGTGTAGSLMQGPGAADVTLQMDPGYAFRLAEGQKGIERSAAARTGTLSGAAAKGMTRYSQDYASGEYGNAYNRVLTNQQNQYSRLFNLSQLGESAAAQTAQLGAQFGQEAGSNIIGAGNATAAGQVGSANAWNNAFTNIGSNMTNLAMLNELRKSGYQTPRPTDEDMASANQYPLF